MLSRREFLAATAAGAALAGWPRAASAAATSWRADFSALADGTGWPGFACVGVANLHRAGGQGLLEAGSDVFPNDPRPVAFAVDRRFAQGTVSAVITRTGAGAGVVLRRTSHRYYYAAIYEQERAALVVVRRSGSEIVELTHVPAAAVRLPLTLSLEARGSAPTGLTATLVDATGARFSASASDGFGSLQAPGDPGVLATARTLFPSERNDAFPALGNVHLLPYGIQEGEAVIESPAGQALIGEIRERSTVSVRELSVSTPEPLGVTAPSVVAATSGVPGARAGNLRVATDLPARVSVEVASRPDFRDSRRVTAGVTGDYEAAAKTVTGLEANRRVYWRARLSRRGHETRGPVRSFRVLPAAGSRSRVTLAVAACASQFGPIFDVLVRRRPDVFVWQGDLNYPDTVGPLAQTLSGYAGIWRDFLTGPSLAPLLERSAFVPGRDDHDYGVQDANSTNLKAIGVAPWEALMERRPYHRFSAGLLETWVLDQRKFKSDPDEPDTEAKTLLGRDQRDWLLETLASSRAPFKLICSPCTLSPGDQENARDGNWSSGFTAERDLLLRHISKRVSGRTIFVTGDTHFTMVYDRGELFEARPCPLDIPVPNDITLVDPLAARNLRGRPGIAYADDRHGHFAHVEVSGVGDTAELVLTLVRADGASTYRKRFEEPIPASTAGGGGKRGHGRRSGGSRERGSGTAASGSSGPSGGGSGLAFTGARPAIVAIAGAAMAVAGAVARRLR
ncbi:MAG TPA: alkaline phosphatase D family protein [Thermoleophilaceae bacterium]